ncbi:hypothetical protein G7M38_03190 [Escherichia coli]|nr:hypothetical protein [Escherichia coli]
MLSEETAQGILTHQYDELGNRTATTFPDGRTQRHLYYGSGHLQQINLDREVISEFTRDHLHREVLRSQGRLSTRQLYDPGGRLKRRETYSGMRGVVPETFTDRQYSYSGEDELLKTRHSRRGETDYFYDPTGRITACRSEDEGYLASWQYDAAGNLLGRRAGERATAENSVVPFNRLMSYRGVHYRYDEFGRAVEKEGRSGTQSYRYDAEHRMVEVTTARGTYRYVYDALGRRTEKQHISPDGKPYNRTKFLWDGMRLAQESRPEGTGSLYIYRDQGSYEPLARVDKAGKEGPNRILYFHTDVNGAPEEMTDSDGRIVWETGYQVWGNTIQEKDHGRVEQNLRYQGQYLDRETGLHYNLHRYYDPDVGRFMVTDPIGLNGGLNLYAYAPNPLSYIDPLGLCKLRGSDGRYRSAQNIQEEIGGLPNFAGKTPGEIRQTLRNRGYSSVQAHSGGEVWTKALPDGNTVAVRIDPANPRSPSHYADAVPHAHIETVPTSSVSNGNYRPRDVTGRHTATGGVSDRGTNPNHNADVHIPMSPGRPPYN